MSISMELESGKTADKKIMTEQAKILIVDDKPQNLQALEEVLSDSSAMVMKADNGNDALILTLRHDFALAILDVQMPEMDGYELAEILRGSEKTKFMPIIFMSAIYSDDFHMFRGYEVGAVDFIAKPYKPFVLLSKVKIFLELYQQKKVLKKMLDVEKKKNYLETILLSMVDGVLVVDQDKRIELANNTVLSLLNYSQKEIINMPLAKLFSAGNIVNWFDKQAKDSAAQTEDKVFYNWKMHVTAKRGQKIPVQLSAATFRKPVDGTLGVVLVIKDITERLKLEEEFVTAKKYEATARIAGGIAHDFNNLLAVILGNIDMVQEEISPENPSYDMLLQARHAADKAKVVTKKFIALSKGGTFNKKIMPLPVVVSESADLALSGSMVECKYSFPEGLWLVNADAAQLGQAIYNVITNAKEALGEQGIIKVWAENIDTATSLQESLIEQQGEYIKLSFQDQGVGISQEHLKDILDPYFSTKERGVVKGMGLGLAVAFSIVKKHDGYIDIKSTQGTGTTVSFFLPAYRGTVAEVGQTSAHTSFLSSHEHLKKRKILVLDDEESVRMLAQQMLEQLGAEVEGVSCGEDAVKQYLRAQQEQKPFSAVILNLTIKGGMAGQDTIQELLKLDPQVKSLVCSGYHDEPIITHYDKYGFSGVLMKPFVKKNMYDALCKILDV